jgi:tetratricopeptide (TPR) repeat protein
LDDDGKDWILYNFGNMYSNQGRLDEAEKMYQRALQGFEKAWGAEHTS